jgi:protein-disulfide isomerase/uncharacterized membrane protein
VPKNRDLKRRAAQKKPQGSSAPGAPTPMGAPAFAAGLAAIVVAIVCAGALALSQLDAFTLPGCGANSGCAGAAASAFGKIPVQGLAEPWSVSFLGVAYFVAVGLAWLVSRRGVSPGLKGVLVVGAFASLFWVTVMLARPDELFCQYCLGTHLANFALVGIALFAGGAARNTRAALATAAIGFVAATLAIGGIDAWSTRTAMAEAEEDATESIEELKARSREQAEAAERRAEAPPAGEADTTTIAAAAASGDGPAWQDAEPVAWNGLEARRQDWPDRGFTGNYLLGDPDAPIRVVVYSSYQCKDCQRVEEEVMDLVRTRDDVSFSHKHFPFAFPCNPRIPADNPTHPNSCWAARAAEIAGYLHGPAGFWTMHEWLFSRGGGFTGPELRAFLAETGWDVQRFLSLMEDERFIDPIREDVLEAIDMGLMYTPFMFVNGVQVRGFRVPKVVTRAVEALAKTDPPRLTAAADVPVGAYEKLITDWELERLTTRLGTDFFVARRGPEDAPIRITAFLGYGHEMAAQLDARIKGVMEGRDDISYTVRFFALGKECNPAVDAFDIPGACHMTRVAEAAGMLYGSVAFFRVHDWILENYASYDEAAFHAAIAGMGLELGPILEKAESSEVTDSISNEGSWLRRIGKPSYALLMVNGRIAPRWLLEGHDVVQGIVDRIDEKSGG